MNETDTQQPPAESKWGRHFWVLLAVNALIFVCFCIAFYQGLPEDMTSHYNASGEADRTMTKFSFWLLYGSVGILLPAVLTFVRNIDPRKPNYNRFRGYFTLMRYAVSVFLHGIFLMIILDNLDYDVPVMTIVMGGIGLLWIVVGNGMSQLRSNFFMGIRTPWTLTDEDNWRRTHRVGARLWVLSGILMFAGAFFLTPTGLIVDLAIMIFLSVVIPYVYSYKLYKDKFANKA